MTTTVRAAVLLLGLLVARAAQAQDTFDAHWRDGQAEIDGYRLVGVEGQAS